MDFNGIFDPENFIFRNLARMVDIVGLSLLWLLLSLPLVTLGPATAALYHTAVHCVATQGDSTYRTFFRSFRGNLRVGIPAGLTALAAGFLMLCGYQIMVQAANAAGGGAIALYAVYCVVMVIPLGALCWAFPLLSRFQMGAAHLLRTSLQVALRHLPSTVVLVLLLLEMIQLTLRFYPLMLVTPAVTALLDALFMERVIRRYLPSDPTEDAPGGA